jgi:hypothetical protein
MQPTTPLADASRLLLECQVFIADLGHGLADGHIPYNTATAGCFVVPGGLWLRYPEYFRSLYEGEDKPAGWRRIPSLLTALSALPGGTAQAFVQDKDRTIMLPCGASVAFKCFYINLDMLEKFNLHRSLIAELLGDRP